MTGLTAAALTAYMVIPEVAEAAESGLSPSLKNFLLSIVAGGVVFSALVGAVIGVANFDPVHASVFTHVHTTDKVPKFLEYPHVSPNH